jgi:hypothetical protein
MEDMTDVISRDPFFKRMTPIDLRVRGVHSNAEYMAKYGAGCMQFTTEEKTELKYLVRTLMLDAKYQPMTWKFVKLQNGIENNWPHTLGDVICLPSNFFQRDDKRVVLRHEAIHVWQRKNRLAMTTWIKNQGWIAVSRPADMCNNPDIDEFAYERNGSLSVLSYLPDAVTMNDTIIKTHRGAPGTSDHPYEEYAKKYSE